MQADGTSDFATPPAANDMINAPQGLPEFYVQYLYGKSANNRSENTVYPLLDPSAESFGKLPPYYVMPLDKTMPEAVAHYPSDLASLPWLTQEDLDVFVDAYRTKGFQASLSYYRASVLGGEKMIQLPPNSSAKIQKPWWFIAPKQDWGPRQFQPHFDKQLAMGCEKVVEIEDAGHWVQQEQPEAFVRVCKEMLQRPVSARL